MAGLNKLPCCAVVILIFCGSAVHTKPQDRFKRTAGNSTLWLSPEGHKESQFGAVLKCKSLHGSLLHILTDSQYDAVKAKILGLEEPIWTSGMYDEGQDSFAWFTLKAVSVDKKYLRLEHGCTQANPGMGLAIQGFNTSTFDLCSKQQDSLLRYICAL